MHLGDKSLTLTELLLCASICVSLCMLHHVILSISLGGRYYYLSPCTDGETEVK